MRAICVGLSSSSFSLSGRAVNDFGHAAVGRIVFEQLRGPQPALAGADFADIDDVAGMERQSIYHGGDFGMRVFALDGDVDFAHAVAVAFLDFVDQIERAGFFEEARIGLDVGEYIAHAAVFVLNGHYVGGHFRLVEIFAVFKFQIGQQFLAGVFGVAGYRDVADFVAWSFVDDECDDHPLHGFKLVDVAQGPGGEEIGSAIFVGVELADFAADACAEKAQSAVIGGQSFTSSSSSLRSSSPLKRYKTGDFGVDLGAEPGVAGDGVAHEGDIFELFALRLR